MSFPLTSGESGVVAALPAPARATYDAFMQAHPELYEAIVFVPDGGQQEGWLDFILFSSEAAYKFTCSGDTLSVYSICSPFD